MNKSPIEMPQNVYPLFNTTYKPSSLTFNTGEKKLDFSNSFKFKSGKTSNSYLLNINAAAKYSSGVGRLFQHNDFSGGSELGVSLAYKYYSKTSGNTTFEQTLKDRMSNNPFKGINNVFNKIIII